AALAAFAAQAAVIYKWTDSDGVVHFSDQPGPGAEKITTGATNLATSGSSGHTADAPATNAEQKKGPLDYGEFSITTPTPEQTFFGDEPVNANLALNPNLKPGQTVTWHLNGAEIEAQGPAATAITLPHLDRGTYVIAATVTDSTTGQSRISDSVTFYVKQPSELSPQHQKP
ncbi:MAG: DUF4124 domain-containing protein, partial [Steroidobacteraceae bacterium]